MNFVSQRTLAADHPAFAGHFEGRPVAPGAVLLAEVLEAALAEPTLAAALGSAPILVSAKFLTPVGPGSELTIHHRLDASSLYFDVLCRKVTVVKGQFARGDIP